MIDVSNLPAWVETAFEVLLIAVVAVIAIVVLRKVVFMSVRGFMERRAVESDGRVVAPVELERRVYTWRFRGCSSPSRSAQS